MAVRAREFGKSAVLDAKAMHANFQVMRSWSPNMHRTVDGQDALV